MSRTSQNRRILQHLAAGHTLTALQALLKFDSLRLASRIHDLRAAGHRIVASTVRKNGKSIAVYRISF